MGKKRIQRRLSKQQFVCFVGCPVSALFQQSQAEVRKEEEIVATSFFFFLSQTIENT